MCDLPLEAIYAVRFAMDSCQVNERHRYRPDVPSMSCDDASVTELLMNDELFYPLFAPVGRSVPVPIRI